MSTRSYRRRTVTTLADEHLIPINILCQRLHTNTTRGLSDDQVKCSLKERGKNSFKIPSRKVTNGFYRKIFGSYEERFTKAEWDVLVGQRIPNEVSVIREGRRQIILGKHLVVGDLIILKRGNVVPADIRLITSRDVTVDNSLITGRQNEPRTHDISSATNDCLTSPNMVFSCTKILEGKCLGLVLRTGDDTVFGTLKNFATKVKIETVNFRDAESQKSMTEIEAVHVL